MKNFSILILILALTLFSIGCEKAQLRELEPIAGIWFSDWRYTPTVIVSGRNIELQRSFILKEPTTFSIVNVDENFFITDTITVSGRHGPISEVLSGEIFLSSNIIYVRHHISGVDGGGQPIVSDRFHIWRRE